MEQSIEQVETLLELRESERDAAEADLADARERARRLKAELKAARADLADLRAEIKQVRHKMTEPGGLGNAADIHRHRMYVDGCEIDASELKLKVEAARDAMETQRQEVQEAESRLRAAQRELQAVTEYAERLREEQKQKQRRRASRKRDETASRVWRENRDE